MATDFLGTTVIHHEGIYKAWGEADDGIHYATSLDGRTWAIHPASPVLVPGPAPESWYDVEATDVPSVVVVDGTYQMFYSCIAADGKNRIAHATSFDGIAWTKNPSNPVLNLGEPGSHDSGEIIHPCVIFEDPVFRIYYNAHDDAPGDTPQTIAYATSYDGVTWARYPSPVLEPGDPGEWDDAGLFMMNVVRYQTTYYMFYTGGTSDGMGNLGPLQVGYATSPDGIGWTKRIPAQPVLGVGGAGAWDSFLVGGPVVMATESGFTMWYWGGPDFEDFAWGLATAEYPSPSVYDYGPYFPLYEGANWELQSVENPANTHFQSVCCPEDVGGVPALLYDVNGEYQIVFRKDGPTITYFGYYGGSEFIDLVPDLILDTFQDGSTIDYPCDTPPCEQFELVRVWSELDHPDLGIYDIDPSLNDLIVLAHYSGGENEAPNHQNEIMESNLPPGMTPPPGAVTDLEWRQLGVGVVALIGVDASTGILHEKYVLVGVSPVFDDDVTGWWIPQLHQNSPNPFNPYTTISFELARKNEVNLRIFDLSGRLARELVGGEPYDAGRHEVVWNGRDDAGRQVASGTYLYRLEVGSYSETKRMVFVK